ncbi:hypothetical protein SEA_IDENTITYCRISIS_31 [Mycobacterium phage IdentityCrisis]|uniref:Lipoprotein n=1 Tax=Mycobacterium phage IdentityCrisis TaxID=2599866 RepID=A0A5J6TGN7_9CAUD|nr:hypothetical protein QEH37_gp31 [Mycobacterium phage IdentityCrisis]QFG10051.1 hypothetical protein SEA_IDENTITYCRISIS_31 [Mycobacterium phage IdentityCrisis]
MRLTAAGMLTATLILAACGGGQSTDTAGTAAVDPVATSEASAATSSTDAEVAAAAQQFVTDNLGGDPSASSWGRYVTGYTFNAGVLRVSLQLGDSSPERQEVGDQAARSVASLIRLGGTPVLKDNVDWVEAMDAAGVHISQEQI